MKQTFILWLSACVITFLAGYINSTLSSDYPVTGTIGIEGRKVSYNLAKKFNTKENYNVLLRSDVDSLNAKVIWKKKQSTQWNEIAMKDSAEFLSAKLPLFIINDIVQYRIIATRNDKNYLMPGNKPVEMIFEGKVPSTFMILYYLTLLGGLLLSTRAGLEYFKQNNHTKRFSILTLIAFFLYTVAVTPVKRTFELDVVNYRVPFITELFDLQSVLFLLLWIAGMTLAFKTKNYKLNVLIISCVTILVYWIL